MRKVWSFIHSVEVLWSLAILGGGATMTIIGYLADFLPLALFLLSITLAGYGSYFLVSRLAKERQEVEQLQTKVDLLKTKSTLFQQQEEEKTRGLEEATRKLNERSEELAKCREKYKNLHYEHGRWWIDRYGIDGEYRNRFVIVQFIALGDRALAEDAKELFSIAWRVKDIEHIQWKQNTCSSHRIVIFSNDEAAPGLRRAINEYNLLGGEQVGHMEKQSGMEDDVTIIIFPEKGSDD